MPKQHEPLAAAVVEALKVDRGNLKHDQVPVEGLPDEIGPDGIYGSIGPVGIGVREEGIPDDFIVLSSAQVDLYPHQVRQALSAALEAKDRLGNDALLISVAAPDLHGYICPADNILYQLLSNNIHDDKLRIKALRHIKTVYIHYWGTRQWFEYNAP